MVLYKVNSSKHIIDISFVSHYQKFLINKINYINLNKFSCLDQIIERNLLDKSNIKFHLYPNLIKYNFNKDLNTECKSYLICPSRNPKDKCLHILN